MASSSFASASEPRPYEVFLSFRGEDTRYKFVSHLLSALDRRGIITYFDEKNLQNGQTIASELVKAIQESPIAIVVLSKDYGSSTWCLNELVKIVECKNKNKLTIYPIFYDVDPSHVRNQQNSFFEAFSLHEVNFKEKVERVNAWREALTEVANLTGVDIRGKNEASCIEEIADEILWKLPLESSHFTESLVGMESRISAIKILINKSPDEVRFIGFWGMGGVGKTTTARAIFEECKSEFEGSCFLQDVRLRKNEMEKLQQQLISQVLKCKIEGINDVVEGSSMIRKRMCRKRVLLVVDDVDDIRQLNVLAGKWSWFGKGSRIIITTRNEHFLNDVHDKYVIDTLNVKEALILFRHHAFKNEHPQENYKKLSHQVLRYAGGLPLALEVLGDHLYRRKELFWLDTLRRLKEVPEQKIISILQISFDDGLNSLQQDIFIYIACFFRGENCDAVMERLRALCLHPEEGIEVLIQKSLIHENRMDTDTSFEMHDLLQDMGQHIVRQRANREVRRYSHLWLEEDIKTVLLDYMGSSEAEGIIINYCCIEKHLEPVFLHYLGSLKAEELLINNDAIQSTLIKEESFMNMNKLRFLQINQNDDYGFGRSMNAFRSSIQLPNGLRWLYWHTYPGKCVGIHPSIPMNLVHLEMPESLIERTPDFSHMPNLEALDLTSSHMLAHIHPSLGRHTKIRRIDLTSCWKLEEFPTIISMNFLKYLNLCETGLHSFPEICGNVDSLEELDFSRTKIKGLPISIQYATGLQKLKLGWMDGETTDLGSLSSFEYLQSLRIEAPYRLTAVPELPSSFRILEMLVCRALKEYPKSFPCLLEILKITGSNIESTPDFSHLPYLLELNLSGSSQLSKVHVSLGVHKKIVRINLHDCINLMAFPTIVDMGCLERLDLSYTKLHCFPEITGNVDNLANLDLEGTCINTLPKSIGRATGLKMLNITSCAYLVSLPISLESLKMLVILPDATKLTSRKGKKRKLTITF